MQKDKRDRDLQQDPTYQRIVRERDIRGMIEHPEYWPHRYGLPLKKVGAKFEDDRHSGSWGFITSGFPLVVVCDLMPVYNMFGMMLAIEFDTPPSPDVRFIRYENIDALLADGWEID